MSRIPPLDPVGDGFSTVAATVQFCTSLVHEPAGVVLGAFDDERVAGLAVVAPSFEPPLAWFAYLNVNQVVSPTRGPSELSQRPIVARGRYSKRVASVLVTRSSRGRIAATTASATARPAARPAMRPIEGHS